MRIGYADPPYPGQALRHYGKNGDPYEGTVTEVDHAELVDRLEREFPDGWALSTSAAALRDVHALCPPGVRTGVWYRSNSEPPGNRGSWWWSWEPVIFRGGRPPRSTTRDVLLVPKNFASDIVGQKPPLFCHWVFALLGLDPDDELVDLFPGSGAVGIAWESWRRQTRLPV